MTAPDPKADLHRYLQTGRDSVLWKLDGLSEYDICRPMVPTGTNLLGLVKHLAGVEIGYFGSTFARPFSDPPAWMDDNDPLDDPLVDLYATADESREQIIALYRRATAHADATITELPLDASGRVPWWPQERSAVTLHQILVDVVAETHRHAGHADIVRELIDGTVGLRKDNDNMAPGDRAFWEAHRARLEQLARDPGSQ